MKLVKTRRSTEPKPISDIDACIKSLESAIKNGNDTELKAALEQEFIQSVERQRKWDCRHEYYQIDSADILEYLIVNKTADFENLFNQLIAKRNDKCTEVFLRRVNQTQLKILTSQWNIANLEKNVPTLRNASVTYYDRGSFDPQEKPAINAAADKIDAALDKVRQQQDEKSCPQHQLVAAKLKFDFLSELKTQKKNLSKYRTGDDYFINVVACLLMGIIPYFVVCWIKQRCTGKPLYSPTLFSVSTEGEKSIKKFHETIDAEDDKASKTNEYRGSYYLMDNR